MKFCGFGLKPLGGQIRRTPRELYVVEVRIKLLFDFNRNIAMIGMTKNEYLPS
jgi:hypothetical protein